MKKILSKIEKEYGLAEGELDRFNPDNQYDSVGTSSKFEIDSAIGHFGLIHVLNQIADTIKDPVESDLVKTFINEVTARLTEDDIEQLTHIVTNNLADFSIGVDIDE